MTWKDIEWLTRVTKLPVLMRRLGMTRCARSATAPPASLCQTMARDSWTRLRRLFRYYRKSSTRWQAQSKSALTGASGVAPTAQSNGLWRAGNVGRGPILWGLAVGGEAGVKCVLEMLRQEFDLAMALSGCPRLAAITRDLVVPSGLGIVRQVRIKCTYVSGRRLFPAASLNFPSDRLKYPTNTRARIPSFPRAL